MTRYASSDLVQFSMSPETTEGVYNATGTFGRVLTTGLTVDPTSNIEQDPTVSGAGEPIDARTNLRGISITTPARMRFRDNRVLVKAALRDDFTAEATVVGNANIVVATNGTHQDSVTGPQYSVESVTAFDAFIGYGRTGSPVASTTDKGGAEQLMLVASGSTNAGNNGARRIKAVWKNATHSFIDIEPAYHAGTAGTFGGPLTAEDDASITLKVGATSRNTAFSANQVGHSMKWNFSDMVNHGAWQSAVGMVAGDLAVSWSGKGGVEISVPWIGYSTNALQATDPGGTNVDTTRRTPMILGASDLAVFSITTPTRPIVMSSLNLTSFSYTLAGNLAAIDDVSGTTKVTGVRRGSHSPSGSIDYYNTDNEVSELLTQLGAEGTSEQACIDIGFRDADGNQIWLGCLSNEFMPAAPSPGAENNTVGGSLGFSGQQRTRTSRSFVWQEFSA